MYFLLDICRLCLSYKNEFYDLSNDDIMEKLVTCISDLEFEDHIPSVICDECLEQVDLYYEFRNKCLRSEFIINNYVEKLRGINTNSHLRSKLQVKISKNFSSSKFPSNVNLPHSILPLANSSKNTNINENNIEDPSLDVHTDITERVKLRKRLPVKRLQSITPEKPLPSVDSSQVTENARQNLPPSLQWSPILSEESNSSVNSSIPDALERVSFDPSLCPQTSIQSKSCPIQSPFNPNHDLTESSSRSVNFEQNQPDNSNQNVAQQEDSEKLMVILHQNQMYSEKVPANSNQNVLADNPGDIVIDEELIILEIKEEKDDPPDPEKSLVTQRHSRSDSCTPSVDTPMQRKRKEYTMTNYVEQNTTKHISSIDHSYSDQLYMRSRKKPRNLTTPSTYSSNSEENYVDVEAVSEDEGTANYYNIKNIKEQNRRSQLRTYFDDLVRALPSNIKLTNRSQINVLKESEYCIKALEKKICKNSHVLSTLKEKNLQLRTRLKEIAIV